MLVRKVTVSRLQSSDMEAQSDMFGQFLGIARQHGHILGNEYTIASFEDRLEAYVRVPADDAFNPRNYDKYTKEALHRLSTVYLEPPVITIIGDDDASEVCTCHNQTSYILFTHFLTVQSPINCGECFGSIPLYRFSKFPLDDFRKILSWQIDYQACDTLFINSDAERERFGYRQMSALNSSLCKQGLALCRKLEEAEILPVYYYLSHYYGRSKKAELVRKCPQCDGDWALSEPWHKFDFRCDTCRLVSNLACELF